ncbi:MAG: hypothetical protein H0U80_03420, partial [Solirubrobacterales bacterium]|nr:hypothetical protein [Solirubrobacterales bacterium]
VPFVDAVDALDAIDQTADPLPELPLEPDWKVQPRLWGHSLHPMCTYFGAFPAALANAFIARLSRPGDVVIDPFCGRGTVPLQACVTRRIGVGVDANPLASLLTGAKVDAPDRRTAIARIEALRLDWSHGAPAWTALARAAASDPERSLVPAPRGQPNRFETLPPAVVRAFHLTTLGQLLMLRHELDPAAIADRFLLAALAGILHGRSGGYLSAALPNTFSLAPRYTSRFVAERGVPAPQRDVFRLLAAKSVRLFRDPVPSTRGIALDGDARNAGARIGDALRARGHPERARLVVSSPPYLRVVRYGTYNWLRLWLLGADPAEVDARLETPPRPGEYAHFMRTVLASLGGVLSDDAAVVLVVGDVSTDRGRPVAEQRSLCRTVWEEAARPLGYRLAGVSADPVAAGRKVTRIWGPEAGRATDIDRILVIAPTELGRRRALAALRGPVAWDAPVGRGASGAGKPLAILGRYAADVPSGRPRGDGSAGADEEPGSRADDQPAAQLRPAAAGPSVRA